MGANLRELIEFYPPGLIVIRGPAEAALFIQALPRQYIATLSAKGYCFFVLPDGIGIEAIPDEVLEEAYIARQAARARTIVNRPKEGH